MMGRVEFADGTELICGPFADSPSRTAEDVAVMLLTQRRYSAMTEQKDQGLVEDETETAPDTGADDDGPKNDPVPVDPNQLPLESGDEGDVKETEGA